MTANVHLEHASINSVRFDDDGFRPFTTVRIADAAGNDVSLFVNARSAAAAVQLADALRAAALTHLPAPEPAVPVEV